MFASNNDARANATPKTILLDMAPSQSTIELRRKPVSSEWEITTERVNQLARQIVEHVAVAIPLKVHIHGRGQITKSFALLHEVTVPRPREMIGQYWNSVFGEEREHFESRLDRLLGIRVIEKFHAWILDQQHGMMRDVAYEEERLTIRLHVEHGVPERVAWRRDCRDAWQKLLLIIEKYQSIPDRQQVLSRVDDERLLPRRVHLSFISPVIKIGLAHVNLRIRIHQSTALIDDAADVVDMTVRDDNGVDVLALDPGIREAFCKQTALGSEHS